MNILKLQYVTINMSILYTVLLLLYVQLSTSCDELEKTRGELAANSVKLNNVQTQLVQLKTLLSTKDTELQQLKV